MNPTDCKKCRKRSVCIDPDICPKVGPILHRLEYGDVRYKKNRQRIELRFEASMDRIEYIIFKNKVYGAYDGD